MGKIAKSLRAHNTKNKMLESELERVREVLSNAIQKRLEMEKELKVLRRRAEEDTYAASDMFFDTDAPIRGSGELSHKPKGGSFTEVLAASGAELLSGALAGSATAAESTLAMPGQALNEAFASLGSIF